MQHIIQAAASSTSTDRANQFLQEVGAPSSASPYGSYEELVADPNVDIVYVATPHSHHFQNCIMALRAGKHVCCEKPLTVNAAQARILVDIARQRKLFLMEAVWTRFFPLSTEIRELVNGGRIGQVRRVIADLSFAHGHSFPDSHRAVS